MIENFGELFYLKDILDTEWLFKYRISFGAGTIVWVFISHFLKSGC